MQARLAVWLKTATSRLRRDDGQALVEYSILIGLITVGVILTVVFVGGWITTAWADLKAALP